MLYYLSPIPEVVHAVFITDPFTLTLLIVIIHPMLHCWPLKMNLIDGLDMSNDLFLSPTGW